MIPPPEPQLEIHLPDEDRAKVLDSWAVVRCACGREAALFRRIVGCRQEYRVECWVAASNTMLVHLTGEPSHVPHTDPTPWLKSSATAIRHWKLVAALSKP
jgi:hypothetical protein